MKIKTLHTLVLILSLGISTSFSQSLKDTAVVDYQVVDKIIDEKVQQFGARRHHPGLLVFLKQHRCERQLLEDR